MAACEVCGNDYDKKLRGGCRRSPAHLRQLECAIHQVAPVCEHCGCRVIGHGVEVEGRFYCCAHCAREAEPSSAVKDRASLLCHAGQVVQLCL